MTSAVKRAVSHWLSKSGIDPTRLACRREDIKKRFFQIRDFSADKKKTMINIGGGAFYRRHWKTLDYASPSSAHYQWVGIDINFDLMSGAPLPFNDESVDFFYSAHTFEHLGESCIPHLFEEIRRCLKPGGAVRLTMPDIGFSWERFRNRRWQELPDLASHVPSDKFRAAVIYYGEDEALKRFAGWPKEPPPRAEVNIDEEESARLFLDDFATYFVGKEPFDAVWKNVHDMTKEEFADHYTKRIPATYIQKFPYHHSSWWSPQKAVTLFQESGLAEAYESQPFQSRFAEMRGVGKYWGFDYQRPHSSIYVEAVK